MAKASSRKPTAKKGMGTATKFGLAALLTGAVVWGTSKKKTTAPPKPQTPVSLATQLDRTHVHILDNNYSMVVHNGIAYYDDTPGYLDQYFAMYGKKQTTYPKWDDFVANIPTTNLWKPLSALFTASASDSKRVQIGA